MIARVVLFLLASLPAWAGDCEAPARAAELAFGVPGGLLEAIGRVESGRRDFGGRVSAWPWSVNAAGQGYFLQSSSEAIALVASLQARGVRSIDVGCFQINLMHHPGAFASLADAFDPARNAMEAARFLRDLRTVAGEWQDAVARYHSATPSLGLPYLRQVLASWEGGPAMASPPVSQVMNLVRVIVPHGALAPFSGGPRLPVVITPSHAL